MKATDVYYGRHPEQRGRSATVRVNAGLPRTSCQALDYAHGDREEDGPYKACSATPFATISDGTGAADAAVLCWRHLCNLGDTGTLKVEPYTATEEGEST